MLAIVERMKHRYLKVIGLRFQVLTDHTPLRHWKTQRDLSKRQLELLCNFDFDINITNAAANALPCYPFEYVNTVVNIDIDVSKFYTI